MVKDILVIATSVRDQSAFRAASHLAQQHGATVRGVFLTIIPEIGVADPGLSASYIAQIIADARAHGAKEREQLTSALKALPSPIALDGVEALYGATGETAALLARHADLSVLPMPGETSAGEPRRIVFERVLFGSGRPVLLVPDTWNAEHVGSNVLIGWNASKEAARALGDARPLFVEGCRVRVATVDARPTAFGHGDAPGADIALHLSRAGLRVDVKNLDGMGRSAAQAIADEARDMNADLIVIGGYGHARLQQIVFGGVTRQLTASSPIPLFLSH